jgi:hypothetical protein
MKPRNLVRIKINGCNAMKVCCHQNRDYIFSWPRITSGDTFSEMHSTFHSRNGRRTMKITGFGCNEMDFVGLQAVACDVGYKGGKEDIDLLDEEIIDEKDQFEKFNQIICFGHYNTGDDFIKKNFSKSKSEDATFNKVVDVKVAPKNSVKIRFFIRKLLPGFDKRALEKDIDENSHMLFDSIEQGEYAILVTFENIFNKGLTE